MSKRILLIGNGVNLVASSNEKLKNDGLCERFPQPSETAYKQEKRPNDKFFELCKELVPTFVHHALASLDSYFAAIMTTNYDFAMERALGVSENSKRVFHLHEDANSPDMCIYTEQDYIDVAHLLGNEVRIQEQAVDWRSLLCTEEVHICGHSFAETELLLYRAFEYRKKRILSKPDFDWNSEQNRIYAWLFYEGKGVAEKRIAAKLRDLRVTPILIKVPTVRKTVDYVSAWELLLGRLTLHLNNVHVHRGVSCKFKGGKSRNGLTRELNVSAAFETSLKYPNRCCVSVPEKKLKRLKKSQPWLFFCELEGHVFLWKIEPTVLSELITKYSSTNFYLNYKTGALYQVKAESSVTRKVETCTKINTVSEFDSLVVDIK